MRQRSTQLRLGGARLDWWSHHTTSLSPHLCRAERGERRGRTVSLMVNTRPGQARPGHITAIFTNINQPTSHTYTMSETLHPSLPSVAK